VSLDRQVACGVSAELAERRSQFFRTKFLINSCSHNASKIWNVGLVELNAQLAPRLARDYVAGPFLFFMVMALWV